MYLVRGTYRGTIGELRGTIGELYCTVSHNSPKDFHFKIMWLVMLGELWNLRNYVFARPKSQIAGFGLFFLLHSYKKNILLILIYFINYLSCLHRKIVRFCCGSRLEENFFRFKTGGKSEMIVINFIDICNQQSGNMLINIRLSDYQTSGVTLPPLKKYRLFNHFPYLLLVIYCSYYVLFFNFYSLKNFSFKSLGFEKWGARGEWQC